MNKKITWVLRFPTIPSHIVDLLMVYWSGLFLPLSFCKKSLLVKCPGVGPGLLRSVFRRNVPPYRRCCLNGDWFHCLQSFLTKALIPLNWIVFDGPVSLATCFFKEAISLGICSLRINKASMSSFIHMVAYSLANRSSWNKSFRLHSRYLPEALLHRISPEGP
jgi:hypothetical protein